MTYEELNKIAEDIGYKVNHDIDFVILTRYKEDNVIKISTIQENCIFSKILVCFAGDSQMLQASLECAETPLEDRYPEKNII